MGAKERNKNYVLEKAKEVFLERGITGVSMADVAKEADFGVASVYRYFGNRKALIMECAVSIWQDKRDKLRVVYEKNLSESGYEQIVVLTKYFSWLVVKVVFKVFAVARFVSDDGRRDAGRKEGIRRDTA